MLANMLTRDVAQKEKWTNASKSEMSENCYVALSTFTPRPGNRAHLWATNPIRPYNRRIVSIQIVCQGVVFVLTLTGTSS